MGSLLAGIKSLGGGIVKGAKKLNEARVELRDVLVSGDPETGDQITITVYPSKAGTPVGVVNKLVLSGKTILDNRGGQQ